MTVLHGDVTKVKEVLKKGYAEPIVQTTQGYTITTGALAAATHTYNLPNIPPGYRAFVKKISVTCDSTTTIHRVYLTRITTATGYAWAFFTSYFYIGDEWDTGDVPMENYTNWTVAIVNNTAGASFTVNVYWIESPTT